MKRYHVDGGIPTLEAALSEFMLCLLLEYAATLGLIDVALIPPAGARRDYGGLWGTDELVYFSRYDGLMYFRVTPLGAYCLGSHGRGPQARNRRVTSPTTRHSMLVGSEARATPFTTSSGAKSPPWHRWQ